MWFSGWWSGWSSGAVVGACGVDGEGADDLAGGGVDDAYVEVGDEQDDGGSCELAADADVVQDAVVAEGDFAGDVDAVVSDAVVGGGGAGGGGLGSGGVGDCWCGSSGE